MPVTCHHRFEPCRRALSSKLAGAHPLSARRVPLSPPSSLTLASPTGANERNVCSISDPIGYIRPPAIARFSPRGQNLHAGYLSCYAGSHTMSRSIPRVDYPKRLLCERAGLRA